MERSLITWSIPNLITIWLMLIALVVLYALGAQLAMKAGWISSGSTATANNAGGY